MYYFRHVAVYMCACTSTCAYHVLSGFHTGFFAWGGNVFSHASMKHIHVHVGGSGGIPPGNFLLL